MPRSTILVIDDEPNILTTVRRSLELEGYQVEVASGGAAGLAKLAEHDVDLILLDVIALQLQRPPDGRENVGLVIDDENRAAGHRSGPYQI